MVVTNLHPARHIQIRPRHIQIRPRHRAAYFLSHPFFVPHTQDPMTYHLGDLDETEDEPSWEDRLTTKLSQWLGRPLSVQFVRRVLGVLVLSTIGVTLRRVQWSTVLRSLLGPQPEYHRATTAPISRLWQSLQNQQLRKVWMGPSVVYFLDQGASWNRAQLPPNAHKDLLDRLVRSNSCEVSTLPETLASRLSTPLLTALPFVYLGFVYKLLRSQTGGDDDVPWTTTPSSTTTFRDVAGMDVAEVAELVHYLRDPSHYRTLGAAPPRGLLLHGPPGSGKTLLAKALAGEARVDKFVACSASDFCQVYVGRGAARVRSLFQQLRSSSSPWWKRRGTTTKPITAVLFIDELDALAKTRSTLHSNDEREQTLNQLLTEMDGFGSSQDTIVVVAATNRADTLDPAILRRFDRQIHVPYPNKEGRTAILELHGRKIKHNVDWSAIETGECSGADLRNVVNDAALLAVREKVARVEQRHVEEAVRRLQASKKRLVSESSLVPLLHQAGFEF